jgi:hypothetical protein
VSLPLSADQLRRLRNLRLLLGLVAFAAVTVWTVLLGHARIFALFGSYDDEGYMLIALKAFLGHGHLYDEVFSQYGPFYYEFWGAVFELFSIPVTHDGGRTVTLVAWVASALCFGFATWRMTRSVLLGLATQILVFGGISTVINEPMHPGGIICLLLGMIVALSCFVRRESSPMAMALLGGAVMALILVKINVGAFALLSLTLACVVSYPELARRRWLRPLVELLFVAVPLLLMASKFGEGWARHYAIHVSIAAFAIVIALRSRSAIQRSREELWWLVGGLIVVGATVCLAIIGAGTSAGGLIEGVFAQPLHQSDAFSIPLQLDRRTYVFDLLGLAGATCFWYVRRGRRTDPTPTMTTLASLASIVIGVEMALSIVGRTALFDVPSITGYQFAFLPFAWVALIPLLDTEAEATSFPRLLLPLLAVLQALHAYPVAGSQVQWSVFLLIPVGALCVANGARGLAWAVAGERNRRAVVGIAALVAVVMMGVLVNTQLRAPLMEAELAYDEKVSLGLPGAGEIHLAPEEVDLYRRVTRAIDDNCNSLLMLPGMNSFYLWAEREPPTGYNATAWITLFNTEHQERVIEATAPIKGLCLLENEGITSFWTGGAPPSGLLVEYLHRGFRPLRTIGGYRLLRREGSASGTR